MVGDSATALKVEEALEKGGRGALPLLKHKILVGDCAGLSSKEWVRLEDLMSGAEPIADRETSSSEVIQIFFTSGTTGAPKMVPHTQVVRHSSDLYFSTYCFVGHRRRTATATV